MAESIPPKPVGESPKWFFMRRVWDFVFGGHFPLKGQKGVKVEWGNGVYMISAEPPSRQPRQESFELQTYRVKSRLEDVLVCHTYDGTTEGTEDVFVAVNRNCRYINSLDAEVLFDGTHTYTAGTDLDAFNLVRIDTLGADTEEQVVSPLYYEDCEIDVMQTNYSGVYYDDTISEDLQPVTLIEVSARCWAKIEDPPA